MSSILWIKKIEKIQSFDLSFLSKFSQIIIFIIILVFWEFFTPALPDGFSLESEGQQVSSNLQDSSS